MCTGVCPQITHWVIITISSGIPQSFWDHWSPSEFGKPLIYTFFFLAHVQEAVIPTHEGAPQRGCQVLERGRWDMTLLKQTQNWHTSSVAAPIQWSWMTSFRTWATERPGTNSQLPTLSSIACQGYHILKSILLIPSGFVEVVGEIMLKKSGPRRRKH